LRYASNIRIGSKPALLFRGLKAGFCEQIRNLIRGGLGTLATCPEQ
jgi:hypothetical protein